MWSVSHDDTLLTHHNRRIETVKHECLIALNNSSMALLYTWRALLGILASQGKTCWKASMPCKSDTHVVSVQPYICATTCKTGSESKI
jgi:hypothetical protein